MKKVFKYPLLLEDSQIVEVPSGYKILSVEIVADIPCLYALVNPEATKTQLKIFTYGTGHDIPDTDSQYVGTYKTCNDALVFHVFVRG